MASKKKENGMVWGVILVALGVIFLFEQVFKLNIFREIWQFWPVILIVWASSSSGMGWPPKVSYSR